MSAAVRRQGTAGLRGSCVACEVRCGILPRLFGDILQLAKEVLVRVPVAVHKQRFGIGAPAPLPDSIGESLADFDCAGLLLLAVKRQGRARQVRMTILPVGFVVSRHAADKEVEKKSFLGVGGTIEHVQFVVRMGYNGLLVVFRFFIFFE